MITDTSDCLSCFQVVLTLEFLDRFKMRIDCAIRCREQPSALFRHAKSMTLTVTVSVPGSAVFK